MLYDYLFLFSSYTNFYINIYLTGGDFSFQINQQIKMRFSEKAVRFYMAELVCFSHNNPKYLLTTLITL